MHPRNMLDLVEARGETSDVTSGREATLPDLLDAARRANPATRLAEYRDAIATYGPDAVGGVAGWLDDGRDCWFAVTVIERAGTTFGARDAAVRELKRALASALDADFRQFVEGALGRLGAKTSPPSRGVAEPIVLPDTMQVAPPYDVACHIVVDYVADSGTGWGDIYLFACRRYFSGRWVRTNGGLGSPRDVVVCYPCKLAVTRGA